ncbi:hypothetical protein [Neptuniibacter sp.]|uniref:hypothetical protein n=1 Tax=Neptuniibacter sp. TaxID=1962643 RepID=UPI00261BF8B1|nr:hypothetical protein [Neptuniibacter sp.]MCP4597820.1 hypothetical protein [Neptuniibacter sp.]
MKIAKKLKEEAAAKMAEKVYKPQLLALAEEMKAFMQEAFDYMIKPGADAAVATGVDQAYLCKAGMFNIFRRDVDEDRKSKGYSHHHTSEALKWEQNKFVSASDIQRVRLQGSKSNIFTLCFGSSHVVPSGFNGELDIDTEKYLNDPFILGFADRLRALNKQQVKLIKEADEYESSVFSVLEPLTTRGRIEETFPAALDYLPEPKPKTTQLVPVDLINNLTKQLHSGAQA